ncbi:hypothetical protein J4E93_010479 [Alternaria ventricosa]|uniref:uncharacterized protein n=1 Tax=Alternaria ventricosa TaxID=1187951 RepID=UPI0020C4B37B|nr:uncharacterized protein J4E93_010479 [Alternaria ventricosa]KAI4638011.1 hypothetical protein J4E93_010479 [Alternaria ventricosa]
MTELRNTIYEHFIDLKPWPCCANAPNLLWINQQIRAEFGSLYLSQDNTTVSFYHLADFLRLFVLPPANLFTKDVAYKVTVELCYCDTPWDSWVLDLVEVVSIMRQYPLVDIVWAMPPFCWPPWFDHFDVARPVSIMRSMEDQEFELLTSGDLIVRDRPYGMSLDFELEDRCTEQDYAHIQFKLGGLKGECGELRNTVYKYLLDLEPSLDQSIQFLQVNRQIRSEFGSLYLSQGNAIVPLDCLMPFLRDTFQPIASQRPKDFTCSFRVKLDWNDICWHRSFWDLDLFETVAFMRGYPLLNIEWDLNPFNRCSYSNHSNRPAHSGRGDRSDVPEEEEAGTEIDDEDDDQDQDEPDEAGSEESQPEESESEEADSEEEEIAIPPHSARVTFSVDDIDIDAPLSILRNLEDELYAKLAAIDLSLSVRPPLDERFSAGLVAYLDIALMANCTEQDFEDVGLDVECGGIKVRFHIAHEPESEYNVSGSEEDE